MSGNGDAIVIEPARKSDASELAVLTDTAGHGLPAHFWATADERRPGVSLLDIGRERILRDGANFSWRNAWVARVDGAVAGMVLGYPQETDFSGMDFDALPGLIRPLIELEAEAPGSWYLNVICVHAEHRGRNIGARLIEQAARAAREAGTGEISLIVEDTNMAARRFYARMGFMDRASRPFLPFPMRPAAKEWVLVVRALD